MIFFLGIVAVATVVLVPGWYWRKSHGAKGNWILALPLATSVFWFLLIYCGVGQASLSNLMEIYLVAAFAVFIAYLKFLVLDRLIKKPDRNTMIIFAIALLFSLLLRLFMPALPE